MPENNESRDKTRDIQGSGSFLEQREQRARLVEKFLSIMAKADNPGSERSFGSTMKQLTGQHSEHYWTTVIANAEREDQEFTVFEDGRHGWSSDVKYSDRPRKIDEEPSPHTVQKALDSILKDNNLGWGDLSQN